MDIDSFMIHIQATDVYEYIVTDAEKRFDTSVYIIESPLQRGKNKTVIGRMKDELKGKIMTNLSDLDQKRIFI